MEHRMSYMTQMEIADAIAAGRPVIVPTGATEAHGPHMPVDTDTHQAEHIALRLAERIGAIVAPPDAVAQDASAPAPNVADVTNARRFIGMMLFSL